MKKNGNIAFVVEILLLFVILLFVIVTITRIFMTSRRQSEYARHLTEAVSVAEEVAEITASAYDRETAMDLMKEMDQAHQVSPGEDGFSARLAFQTENRLGSEYDVSVRWEEEPDGGFVQKTISVFYGQETDPLYTLHSGQYVG